MIQPTIRPIRMTTTPAQNTTLEAITKPMPDTMEPAIMMNTQVQAAGLLPWPMTSSWMLPAGSVFIAVSVAVAWLAMMFLPLNGTAIHSAIVWLYGRPV